MSNLSAIMHLFCCMFYVQILYVMESEQPVIKTDKEQIVWEIILTHGIKWFDYKMIGSLAVNKKFDRTILYNTAEQRKKYLSENIYVFNNTTKYSQSHCYGAVQGQVAIQSLIQVQYYIWLDRQCLVYPMKLADYCMRSDFYRELPHRPKPFFNKLGDFCFYGYGNIADVSDDRTGSILEYSVCANGKSKVLSCVTNIEYGDCLFTLAILLEFPFLLQAFLSSRVIYEQQSKYKRIKVFGIEGITIPNNYIEMRKYFSVPQYAEFDALPKVFRKAINKLYKKQNKQENCNIV